MVDAKKKRMFVGSSTEGLPIAQAIQAELDHDAEVTLWSQGVFGLSMGTLETLVGIARTFEFAVLVLTPDDVVQTRGETRNTARDNVLFELGLFMGALGRERTAIIHPRNQDLTLPSDLAGVATATFEERTDGNTQAALGAACHQLREMMRAPSPIEVQQTTREAATQALALLERVGAHEDVATLREEADALRQTLEQLQELAGDAFCPHCNSPVVDRRAESFTVEHEGREADIDHDMSEFACGLRIEDGAETQPCGKLEAGAEE